MSPDILLPFSFEQDSERFIKENGDFIIVQLTGGQSPLNSNLDKKFVLQGQKKNYIQAQKLINNIHEKYPDLKILNYSLPNENQLENTIQISAPYLFYVALLKKAKTFIAIDSSLNHMSAVAGKKGVVLWMGTSSIHFGYKHNINLSNKECNLNDLHCSRPYVRELGDLDASGKIWECSNPVCQNISINSIMKPLEKLL
jgi:hypothetical protein